MKKCKWREFIALLLTAIMVMTNAAMVWADETDYAFSDDSWYSSACYYTAFSVQPVEVMGDMCRVPIILNAQHDSDLGGEMHTCNEAFIVVSFRAPLPQEVTAAINRQPVEFSADRTKGRALFIYHQNAYDTINTDLFIECYGLSTDFLEYINQTMGMENMFSPIDIAINDVPFRIDRYGNPIPVYTYYPISVVQTLGGTITVGPESAREGDLVTIEAQPDEGMFLNGIYVNCGAVEVFYQDGVYCFYMPASDVTVTAEWIENSSWSWSDCFFSATTSVQPIEDGCSGLIVLDAYSCNC